MLRDGKSWRNQSLRWENPEVDWGQDLQSGWNHHSPKKRQEYEGLWPGVASVWGKHPSVGFSETGLSSKSRTFAWKHGHGLWVGERWPNRKNAGQRYNRVSEFFLANSWKKLQQVEKNRAASLKRPSDQLQFVWLKTISNKGENGLCFWHYK